MKRAVKGALRALPRRMMVWSGPRSRRQIALTFDDGPDRETTPELLSILRRFRVPATFFVVGNKAEAAPDLVRQIRAEGHELGSHSHTHPEFEAITWREAREEIRRSAQAVEAIQERPCRLFRPPKGKLCLNSLLGAWRARQTVVMWSADLKDFAAREQGEIVEALKRQPLRDGDILLYHGLTPASLGALPTVLESALEHARTPVAVSQMVGPS